MGFLNMLWGTGRPAKTVSQEEFEAAKREYDRKLAELDEAVHALKGHEPDPIRDPGPRWNPNAP